MNPEEYAKLDRLDRAHWFYAGKRAIVRHWIDRYITLEPADLLIDAGMGTGTWLVEMSARCRVLGIDASEESLALARDRVRAAAGEVLQSTLDRVPLPDACATVITLLDVLEHLDDDRAAMREMTRLARPGGLIVITVPALRWLWSDWDVALHHRRRYHERDLRALVQVPGLELLRCSYFNTLLLPAIALVRSWRKLRPPRADATRAEDQLPPAALNSALRQAMVAPACWGWCRPPLGVSLLAVLRRTST